MKAITALVVCSSLAALAPLASAGTLPSCDSATDSNAVQGSAGFYLSNTDGWSVWSEANGLPGLQTSDCVDGSGSFHHADLEQFATAGSKSQTCLTGSLCTFL